MVSMMMVGDDLMFADALCVAVDHTFEIAGVADVNVSLWSGLFGPAHLPPEIAKKLEAATMKIMQMDDVKERFKAMATPTVGSTAADSVASARHTTAEQMNG